MKRILITGSNGYIANQIKNKLDKTKYEIIQLNRQVCDLIKQNQVISFFKNQKYFDFLIHTATTGGSRLKKDQKDVYQDNIKMVKNILKCKNKFDKMLFFSSGAQLDNKLSTQPYGRSKKYITNMLKNYNFNTTFRIWNVFNQNQKQTRFIKSAINNYINNKPIIINENKLFDFFHIDDLIDLINNWLNDKLDKKIVNCVYNDLYKLSDVSNIINNFSDYKVPIIIKTTEEIKEGYFCKNKRININNLEKKIKQMYYKLKELNNE